MHFVSLFISICTNLEDDASVIIKVNQKRWEIEECFRIMKTHSLRGSMNCEIAVKNNLLRQLLAKIKQFKDRLKEAIACV